MQGSSRANLLHILYKNKLCCVKCPWLGYLILAGSVCMQKFIQSFLFLVRLMHISCWQSDLGWCIWKNYLLGKSFLQPVLLLNRPLNSKTSITLKARCGIKQKGIWRVCSLSNTWALIVNRISSEYYACAPICFIEFTEDVRVPNSWRRRFRAWYMLLQDAESFQNFNKWAQCSHHVLGRNLWLVVLNYATIVKSIVR